MHDPTTPLDVKLAQDKGLMSKPVGPLRWGILGASRIASDWCKCLQEVEGATLQAVAARDSTRAAEFALKWGVKSVHETYNDLVKDENVDIVYVGTITALHKEHSLLAIAAGKHVLCEKPLALTAEDAQLMYAAAKKHGVMLQEGMWTRFFPAVEHARQIIASGGIGEVSLLQTDFSDMCYAVQYASMVFDGSPVSIAAAGHFSKAKCGAEVSGAVLSYGKGGCAMMTFPRWDTEFPEVCEIIGTKGRLTLDLWASHPTRLTVHISPDACFKEPQGHTSTSQSGILPEVSHFTYPLPDPAGYPANGWNYVNQHGFVYQAKAIQRCISKGILECPQYTQTESLATLKILDEIEKQTCPVEVVIIGCGRPKFSMGWTHLFQMLQQPLVRMANVVGVVEPFYMSHAGFHADERDSFHRFMVDNPTIKFVPSCDLLPFPSSSKLRMAIISTRIPDLFNSFKDAILRLKCKTIYLEKPGASSVNEINEMIQIAEHHNVTVMVGYSRNVGPAVSNALKFAEQCRRNGKEHAITLAHSNPWSDDKLPECFQRGRPGMLFDMACHDIALAVANFGLTADGYSELKVDLSKSVKASFCGIIDFVRLSFSLRPKKGSERIYFKIDRQDGSYNGLIVGEKKFFTGIQEDILFENPLPDLSSHLACQYDLYVEAKRQFILEASRGGDEVELPMRAVSLVMAREVLMIAQKLTVELESVVPLSESLGTN